MSRPALRAYADKTTEQIEEELAFWKERRDPVSVRFLEGILAARKEER